MNQVPACMYVYVHVQGYPSPHHINTPVRGMSIFFLHVGDGAVLGAVSVYHINTVGRARLHTFTHFSVPGVMLE
jgi:hypothetical protein